MKDLGFSLDTIHGILDQQIRTPKDLLCMRLKVIELEQQQLEKSKETIRSLIQVMELEGKEDWDNLFTKFFPPQKDKKQMREIWNRHFTAKEQRLLKNLPKAGKDYEEISKWVDIVNDIRKNLDKDPTSNEAQKLQDDGWI